MYVRPEQGGIYLLAGPTQFAEFFPPLTEDEATAAIGSFESRRAAYQAGGELDACLDEIEAFVRVLPRPEASEPAVG